MASVKTLVSGNRKLVVNITGAFSVADETNVVVIDRSTLIGPDGVNVPGRIRIDAITWAVGAGFDSVKLSFDHTTDEVIEYLQGPGYMDYRPAGGKSPATAPSAAADGDVLLSTTGGAANDTYSILLECTLKN